MVENPLAKQETQEMWVQSLGREDPLEEGMATTPALLPGESHRQRRLAGYSPWGHKESDTTEQLNDNRKLKPVHSPQCGVTETVRGPSFRQRVLFLAGLEEPAFSTCWEPLFSVCVCLCVCEVAVLMLLFPYFAAS